ncbi:MAG: Acetyl-coenzyme A carboxylase carboxyl transferase subunit beta [Candidatus Dichloromethanomonas elyunquensis]|nr:MAG: Acetyl-coenzyme A carboxylase carboxyl transferase subunit beta [Candidatus Dichloromethanomonas elyunquensis]
MFKINKVFKKPHYLTLQQNNSQDVPKENNVLPAIPNGLWIKCEYCGEIIYNKDLNTNRKVCPSCGHHFRMNSRERIELIMDTGTFKEINADLKTVNPLNFEGYEEKIGDNSKKAGIPEAVVTGYGKIHGNDAVIVVMDSSFMMGSMGSVVGEKVTRAFEFATAKRKPVIVFTASGGARMQEGIISLMQMAKTSAAAACHDKAGGLYITVLTDPTTGGVTASFAMLGDIILAEPGALIGFAGKRVGEQTIGQKLPEGFQTAEFLIDHGFIDKIVTRDHLKLTLSRLIKLHYA